MRSPNSNRRWKLTLASYAEAHSNLGLALLRRGKSDEAVDEFEKALNIKPDFFETHYALGVALAQKGELQEAITQFREVLRLKPISPRHKRTLLLLRLWCSRGRAIIEAQRS
jgi:protein O-mannosyl-transferase